MKFLPAIRWHLALAALIVPIIAQAQPCPSAGADTKKVRDAISDMQKNDRAPAGADCAAEWASSYSFGGLITQADMDFFKIAADVQRRAYEKRQNESMNPAADAYLAREIEIRTRILEQALRSPDPAAAKSDLFKRSVVIQLSSLVNAMALRREYERAAIYLGGRNPDHIDEEALKVWLQAVWSCAKWDGKKTNVCSEQNKDTCKERIQVFLTSVAAQTKRTLPPDSDQDLRALKTAARCMR